MFVVLCLDDAMIAILKSMDSTANSIASDKNASSLTFSSINSNRVKDTERSRSLSTISSANGDHHDDVKNEQTKSTQNTQLALAVPTPPRSRRVHEKSRAGCQICRKRHVKCDETYPECIKCVRRGVQCEYKSTVPKQTSQLTMAIGHATSNNNKDQNSNQINLQIHQVELMHHYAIKTSRTLMDHETIWVQEVPQLAFQHPFLLHAVLAVSAAHLNFLTEGSVPHYANLSTLHAAQALSGLKIMTSTINEHNVDPVMACSLLLTVHNMATCDTSELPFNETYHFLAHLIQQVTRKMWSWRDSSVFRQILLNNQDVHCQPPMQWPELEILFKPLDIYNPDSSSCSSSFVTALKYLLPTISTLASSDSSFSLLSLALLSFPGLLSTSSTFTKLLSSGDSRAEIIMCYYCASICEARDLWWLRPQARKSCNNMIDKLDRTSDMYLDWPREICGRARVKRNAVGSLKHILIHDS